MSLMPHGHQSGLFINAPMKSVADCLVQWGKENENGRTTEWKNAPLLATWSYLDSDRKVLDDRAFLISIGNWTAYFDNNHREFISSSHPEVLCRRLQVDTCYFYCDDRTPGMEGTAQFGHIRFDPTNSISHVKTRQVMVTHDGGWTFDESGDPLPYEQLDKYKLRKKADRLNPEIMRAYGQALGIPFWDESAYGNEVTLVRWNVVQPGEAVKADSAESSFQRIIQAARAAGIKGKLTWLRREAEGPSRTDEL